MGTFGYRGKVEDFRKPKEDLAQTEVARLQRLYGEMSS